jgi:hypothetical protein
MTPAQHLLLIVTSLGGLGVLTSYYICFIKLLTPQNYIHHDFWVDMPISYRYTAVIFQILAIFGFLRLFVYLLSHTPSSGILSYINSHTIWIILLLFLVSSIIWPFAVYTKNTSLVVISLITAAISCILLLAGCVEAKVPLDVMLSAFVLCIVCVLQDAIMWNASYIMQHKNNHSK